MAWEARGLPWTPGPREEVRAAVTAAQEDVCREVVHHTWGLHSLADPHPLHSCSQCNFPEGAHIKEEEEPGTWVRHSCLPACDRRQFPGSGQEEGGRC